MFKSIEIVEIHFDESKKDTESARSDGSLGVFTGTPDVTAFDLAQAFMHEMLPVPLYLGWDGEVYPKYRLIKRIDT